MEKIDREKFPYRQSTLAVVRDREGYFLLVQKVSYSDTEWALPGGGVDEGETPSQAIMRELTEELNSEKFVLIRESREPYTYEWPDTVIENTFVKKGKYFRGQKLTQFQIAFFGCRDEIVAGDGIRNVKWIRKDELQKHLIFPRQWENTQKVLFEFYPKE